MERFYMKSKGFIFYIIILIFIIGLFLWPYIFGNKQFFDTHHDFDYAYVTWPDGTSEKLSINSWTDYEGDQIQITTSKGTYVFHSSDCVLADED